METTKKKTKMMKKKQEESMDMDDENRVTIKRLTKMKLTTI